MCAVAPYMYIRYDYGLKSHGAYARRNCLKERVCRTHTVYIKFNCNYINIWNFLLYFLFENCNNYCTVRQKFSLYYIVAFDITLLLVSDFVAQ